MREIPLTQNKVAIVDDVDFNLVCQFKWHVHWDGYHFYARRHTGRCDGKDPIITLHSFLVNPPPGFKVDHKDGDGLNNQRGNLRICTHAQNMRNRKPPVSASLYKGLSWNKSYDRWRVRITVEGKCIFLGCFIDEKEAALAYDKAATQLHGEFARLNFSKERQCV